jgi:hypothetical protein
MTRQEAIDVLETIRSVYPKFDISKKKAKLLIPQLEKMDYAGVMDKFSAFIATYPYAPTIAEIAVYPKAQNVYLEEMKIWEKEAAEVPEKTKETFRIAMQELLAEKSHHDA